MSSTLRLYKRTPFKGVKRQPLTAAQKRKMIADTLRGIQASDLLPRSNVGLGLARTNAQALRMELKGMDTLIDPGINIPITVNTNNGCIVLNLVQQGTGSWNRVGRKIHMQSIRLMGAAKCISGAKTTTANTQQAPLRMVLVLDRQTNGGAIPSWNDIFGYTNQQGTESSTVFSPVRYDATERFRVIKDCILQADRVTYVPNAEGTECLCIMEVHFDEYIKLPNIETLYRETSNPSTISDIQSGSLLLYYRTNVSDTDTYWQISDQSIARLRFRD